jgi:hypothetical protein
MRPIKILFLLICVMLFTLACTVGDPTRSQPISTPTEPATKMPIRISPPTQTPPPILFPPTPETTLFPAWVTNFSEPILINLAGRRPDFQDDFSPLNRGWFYDIPGSSKGPYYAHINDGALILKLPEGNEREDSMVFNPTLSRRNFVLSFDLRFGGTQPNDYVEFQFNPTADQSFALDLSKDKNWNFRWRFHNDWKFLTGTYDQFPPERINVVFIVQGSECAVYLNHDPLDYSNICRPDSKYRLSPRAVSFHMIAVPGHTAIVTIDDVKLWDLDEIPVFLSHP